MNLTALLLWQPGFLIRNGILVLSVVLTLLVGYLHTLTGLAYEFHVFFILPVIVVSWFNGKRIGNGVAVLVAFGWSIADWSLAGDQAYQSPLIFNTLMRLIIFSSGGCLVSSLRVVLMRESRLARMDALTQLPNVRQFHERGLQAFAQAQRRGAAFTAVFIDLDRFKEVNDTLGHHTGDAVLTAVARTIREQIRASDIPGRLGGDEFALLLPNMNALAASAYVEKLRVRLLEGMAQKGWPVTFSIGVASYKVAPQDLDMLLKQADALMYEVKRGGRDRILLQEF